MPVKSMTSKEQAYQKIKYFCSYRERCHYEVKEKLFGLGLPKTEVEELVSRLIEDDYLNEERYCSQFAGSHFRLRKWGKVKIVHALRQKRVSEANIKRGLREIDEAEYLAALQKLVVAKWASLKNEQWLNRQAKTMAYLLQKGYEAVRIQAAIAEIRGVDGRNRQSQ